MVFLWIFYIKYTGKNIDRDAIEYLILNMYMIYVYGLRARFFLGQYILLTTDHLLIFQEIYHHANAIIQMY